MLAQYERKETLLSKIHCILDTQLAADENTMPRRNPSCQSLKIT